MFDLLVISSRFEIFVLVNLFIGMRLLSVCFCFCCSEKPAVSHSITGFGTLEVSSVNIPGMIAFETSGKNFEAFLCQILQCQLRMVYVRREIEVEGMS